MRGAAEPPRAVPQVLGEPRRLADALLAEGPVGRPDANAADVRVSQANRNSAGSCFRLTRKSRTHPDARLLPMQRSRRSSSAVLREEQKPGSPSSGSAQRPRCYASLASLTGEYGAPRASGPGAAFSDLRISGRWLQILGEWPRFGRLEATESSGPAVRVPRGGTPQWRARRSHSPNGHAGAPSAA